MGGALASEATRRVWYVKRDQHEPPSQVQHSILNLSSSVMALAISQSRNFAISVSADHLLARISLRVRHQSESNQDLDLTIAY